MILGQLYKYIRLLNFETINTYLDLKNAIQEHGHKNLIIIGDYNGQIGEETNPGVEMENIL